MGLRSYELFCSLLEIYRSSSIVWTGVRDDVQGGFASAGVMIEFLGFCSGIVRPEILTG
jgi:hypothetical protein